MSKNIYDMCPTTLALLFWVSTTNRNFPHPNVDGNDVRFQVLKDRGLIQETGLSEDRGTRYKITDKGLRLVRYLEATAGAYLDGLDAVRF